MPDSVSPSPQQSRSTLGIVFLTLFLDLVGFSIIFPLFPAMLDYYLPEGGGDGTLLGQLVGHLAGWAEASGAKNPRFMTAVLFGGILGSLYSILQFLCAPLWGAWSDKVGRRKVLLITIRARSGYRCVMHGAGESSSSCSGSAISLRVSLNSSGDGNACRKIGSLARSSVSISDR